MVPFYSPDYWSISGYTLTSEDLELRASNKRDFLFLGYLTNMIFFDYLHLFENFVN